MKSPPTPAKTARNHEIVRLRRAGLTRKAIAERFGISQTRVQQIEMNQSAAEYRRRMKGKP